MYLYSAYRYQLKIIWYWWDQYHQQTREHSSIKNSALVGVGVMEVGWVWLYQMLNTNNPGVFNMKLGVISRLWGERTHCKGGMNILYWGEQTKLKR